MGPFDPPLPFHVDVGDIHHPRAYKTIVVCGAFGLGSSRDQDLEALRRIHDVRVPPPEQHGCRR
jgi:hypothetical protein